MTATGAPIIHPDLQASNGIVHIIDKVMFPIPMGVNMPDFLKKDPRFSLLFSFLTVWNLKRQFMGFEALHDEEQSLFLR